MPINVAIVGTGDVARSNYIPYLAKRGDIALTYYSRTLAKAEACARDFGGNVVSSIPALLKETPDTILVLTNENQRYEVTKALLVGRPRRLFFEKPLVAQSGFDNVSEDDFFKGRELLQIARKQGTQTAMVFNYRFFDQTLRACQVVRDRNFGKLTQASFFVNFACWSHCIDLLHYFGGRVNVISALGGEVPHKGAVDVAASFRLINGAVGTMVGTRGIDFDFPLYNVVFNFERGSLHFNDLDVSLDVIAPGAPCRESHSLIGNRSRWDQYRASFQKSLEAYLDSIQRSEPPPVPGLAGLEELQFEAALRRSISQNRPVDVQREFPLEI